MGAKVDAPVRQTLQARRLLQAPVLSAALYVAFREAPAPVLAVPVAVQAEVEHHRFALQVQGKLLALEIAAAVQLEHAEIRIAAAQALGRQVDPAALGGIQGGGQVQRAQALVGVGDALAVELELPLRRLQRAGKIELAADLAEQLRPQLAQAIQRDIQAAGQPLVQRSLPADAVVAQLQRQSIDLPRLTSRYGICLENGWLAAQAPCRSRLASRFNASPLSEPLLRSGPPRRPGISSSQ